MQQNGKRVDGLVTGALRIGCKLILTPCSPNSHPSRDDTSVLTTKVRRVESVSTGTRPNSVVYAGDPIGADWLGLELRENVDVVIVSVDHYADSWLVTYRAVHVRPELSPAS